MFRGVTVFQFQLIFRVGLRVIVGLLVISSASFAAAPDEKKYYETGREAYANDLFDVAEINFIRLLEMFPQSGYGPETRLLLIESLVRQGKYDEAIRGCQNALNRDP